MEEKSFQEIDLVRSFNQTSFLFKYDTGMGKSYMLSGDLAHLRFYNECYKAVILTSSIGIMNLAKEIKGFISEYDPSRTLTIASITELKNRLVFNKDWDIIICGYDTFSRINKEYKKALKIKKKSGFYIPLDEWFEGKKGLLFADECHLIGSPTSEKGKTYLDALSHFYYRYLFSATPFDKKEKAYPILRSLDNALVKGLPYKEWLGTYCEIGTKYSPWAPNLDTWDIGKWTRLQNLLADKYMSVREKSLLNLPPAIDMDLITVDMSPVHREIYEIFANLNAKLMSRDDSGKSLVDKMMNTFQILQLVVDNPNLILNNKNLEEKMAKFELYDDLLKLQDIVTRFDYGRDFSKIACLNNIIEYECKEMGNKILVFYYHPKTLEELKKLYPDAAIISRETPDSERLKIVEQFKHDDNKIMIASIMIANTSFTLTECKAEVFYERQWSGIVHEQAKGRIYRYGTTTEVRYYNMCFNNSIDNIQLETLKTKGEVMKGIGKKTHFTGDEWRLIFGGNIEDQTEFLQKIS